ncbi:glycine cleavage system protein H [Levilactobacillus brevis]|jgi:glycine cleavage system H protein|uniref:Glycine cleavage system H protein (Lipoate-binding) n=2 Tax=Levilactobacillus brevis TaxID=1580 RepID=Q03P62_LEVBA|nr:glycine cleavage system protein H [Levilactobacillus brevis]MBL3537284.1 glycine cleavage system protein H [Lactobacillus sp. GPR40-2]MBL3630471.1 glycine cleavage system protein H [Lactobacillus sp. GPB7-4]ABJ65010.1 Glycine cleavage system H protein (lipoate-binding) [Levilactobacillus brevis ATCC 367]ARQ92599.1 glycine cleavage system protein H [Levilactobacillus brevis]ARW51540.1 Glycine cleavage system H protein [Levilactobacillus brevis]
MTQATIWQRLNNWIHGRHTPAPTLTVKDGVWLEQRDQGHYRLGLASDALEQIGDISFADLPIMVNDVLAAGDDILEVESDKAVENFKTPYAGTVVKVNDDLINDPAKLNQNAQPDNWVLDLQVA